MSASARSVRSSAPARTVEKLCALTVKPGYDSSVGYFQTNNGIEKSKYWKCLQVPNEYRYINDYGIQDKMAEGKYAAICSTGHIIDWKDSHDDLIRQNGCHTCGNTIHRTCPNCGDNTVYAFKHKKQDGSTFWQTDDYCRSCKEAFPWGPGKIGQFLHEKGIQLGSTKQKPYPRGAILTPAIREHLTNTNYGNEVIDKIREGDKCYQNSLWHPALAMYVHALEWTIITYLEDQENVDIIRKERDGTRFNLAGRSPNLLEVLTDKVTLDQKLIERIEDINRAERRWMAHHRTGEVLQDEVDSVRSRLGVLLAVLFENNGGNQ